MPNISSVEEIALYRCIETKYKIGLEVIRESDSEEEQPEILTDNTEKAQASSETAHEEYVAFLKMNMEQVKVQKKQYAPMRKAKVLRIIKESDNVDVSKSEVLALHKKCNEALKFMTIGPKQRGYHYKALGMFYITIGKNLATHS